MTTANNKSHNIDLSISELGYCCAQGLRIHFSSGIESYKRHVENIHLEFIPYDHFSPIVNEGKKLEFKTFVRCFEGMMDTDQDPSIAIIFIERYMERRGISI